MPAVTLTPADLEPFATIPLLKAEALIEDAIALAARVAPCILDDDFAHAGAAKAILREAILRRNEGGTGAITQQGAGPFQMTVDNRQVRRAMFRPDEITQLQDLCRDSKPAAFAIDTAPGCVVQHSPICSLVFGATYCSCGADIAGKPLYEQVDP
ncbi:hypothetical protein [Mycolicibacterium sp.]|uniref:hypothetical protein n=1 Tax=Mycolicibacterium sp. TaxID=2320850 RepID=UPI00355F895C